MEKSKGHLEFRLGPNGLQEYFIKWGEVYRAPISDAIMTDGYRTGRWECSIRHWEQYMKYDPSPRHNAGNGQNDNLNCHV